MSKRQALFGIQILIPSTCGVNCNIFACIIDFKKAFDKMPQQKLIESVEGKLSSEFPVKQGVRKSE